MPSLANIYVRTPQGRITAFSPAAELPAQLKTLLKAVDGKTPTTAIEAAHAALGNVQRMLLLLHGNGLIADKSAAFAKATLPAPGNLQWADSASMFAHTVAGDFGPSLASYFSDSQLSNWNDETVATLDAPEQLPNSVLDLLARQVADSMCTFVLTHLPAQANKEILTIERILTPSQLKAELPRYGHLVKSLGTKGTEHFAVIQQLAAKLFAKAGV
jgi:hypothetical protein